MKCPICNNDTLQDYDNTSVYKVIFDFFNEHANPIHPWKSLYNLSLGLTRVFRSMKYDMSCIKTIHEYRWCNTCAHYFLECPNCHQLIDKGVIRIKSPLKIQCGNCKQVFAYTTPPSTKDGYPYDDVIRPF